MYKVKLDVAVEVNAGENRISAWIRLIPVTALPEKPMSLIMILGWKVGSPALPGVPTIGPGTLSARILVRSLDWPDITCVLTTVKVAVVRYTPRGMNSAPAVRSAD